jgi:ADP-ribose pyrophosphatase
LTSRLVLPPSSFAEEKTLSQAPIHQGKVIALRVDTVQNAHGDTVTREVVAHPGGVCVMPIDEQGRFLLVRQYRYPTQSFLLEFPAGKLDVAGESPANAIKRELQEETGYVAATWKELGFIYTAPGFCDEKIYLYAAKNLTAQTGLTTDEDEAIESFWLTYAELKQALAEGLLTDGKTLALLAHYELSLRSEWV